MSDISNPKNSFQTIGELSKQVIDNAITVKNKRGEKGDE